MFRMSKISVLKATLLGGAYWGLWACSSGPKNQETASETARETAAETGTETALETDSPQTGPAFVWDSAPRHLLFIAFDTTRLDRVLPEIMPKLSEVLEQSVVFQEHRVCSNWTYFSFGCALTGQSNIAQEWVPIAFGDLGAGHEEPPYPDAPEMMAERFVAGGFETALVGSHPFLDPRYNLFQGYQSTILAIPGDAERVEEEAVAKAKTLQLKQAPWMLHVHFNDPHLPYKARPNHTPGFDDLPETEVDFTSRDLLSELVAKWPKMMEEDRADVMTNLNAYYNGELSYMDESFGEMWDSWEALGVLDDTLVVFFTDHGEQFFEHGEFGHRATLFGEETRSLLAFWHQELPGGRWDWTSANEDILPTLLSIFKLPGMENGGHVLNEMEEGPDSPVFAVHGGQEGGIVQSVRMGQDFLIYNWRGFAQRFDLASDPLELVDLIGQDPELEDQLMNLQIGRAHV